MTPEFNLDHRTDLNGGPWQLLWVKAGESRSTSVLFREKPSEAKILDTVNPQEPASQPTD